MLVVCVKPHRWQVAELRISEKVVSPLYRSSQVVRAEIDSVLQCSLRGRVSWARSAPLSGFAQYWEFLEQGFLRWLVTLGLDTNAFSTAPCLPLPEGGAVPSVALVWSANAVCSRVGPVAG